MHYKVPPREFTSQRAELVAPIWIIIIVLSIILKIKYPDMDNRKKIAIVGITGAALSFVAMLIDILR